MRDIKQIRVICEDEPKKSFIVVTTMWDMDREEEGIRREEELKADKTFLKFFADAGVLFMRHPGSRSEADSARDIISRLLIKEVDVNQDRRGHRPKAFKKTRPSAAARLLARLLGYIRNL
jgi:hypothetical protein